LNADEIVKLLGLEPLPVEGGWYRETWRSESDVPAQVLGPAYRSTRRLGTAIYYLLTPAACSALHRLSSVEIFHFYLGDPVTMLQLHPDGSSRLIRLGQSLEKGERPQVVVPGGTWQGSFLEEGGNFALLGTTVTPGFEFEDYEPGRRSDLVRTYPDRRDPIVRLTPGQD